MSKLLTEKILDKLYNLRAAAFSSTAVAAIRPFTLLTKERLWNLSDMARRVNNEKIAGDYVECGTCRGGSGALLASFAKDEGWGRQVFLLDSFQGHPKARNNAPDAAEASKWTGTMAASTADVRAALESVGAMNPDKVHILSGWFEDSLPGISAQKVALAHIDCDFYDPVLFCLNTLDPRLTSGGFFVVDDYFYYEGCRLAVDKFLKNHEQTYSIYRKIGPAIVLKKHHSQ